MSIKPYNPLNNRLNNPLTQHAHGYSLVGMALVIAIVGVLGIGSVSLYSEQKVHVNWMDSGAKLKVNKASLLKFAKLNKYLPCPDTDDDGLENRTAGACTAANGALPYLDLGLSRADVQDSWGFMVGYAVNQNAVSATDIVNCPTQSACFFNNITPPAFNLTTLPLPGQAGSGNLTVNKEMPAGLVAAAVNMVAVLVAYNENGAITSGLGTYEAENRNNDAVFVQGVYNESPYFDDVIETISANELKTRFESESVVNAVTIPTQAIAGSNTGSLGENKTTGGSGHNVQTRPVDTWDYNNQNFDFGAGNAGKTVTLKFDAEIIGGWEDGSRSSGGVAHTQDQFIVGINGTQPDDGTLDSSQIATLLNTQQELEVFTYDDPSNRDNTGYNSYDSWNEYKEYNVVLDESGQVNVNFVVGSTHTTERVVVSNVEVILYNPPPTLPSFPSVYPIEGVSQTQGLTQ